MAFKQFIRDGKIVTLPEHYAEHPVFGKGLTPYDENEVEVEKVVLDNHELPLEQRISQVVVTDEVDFVEDDTDDDKEND